MPDGVEAGSDGLHGMLIAVVGPSGAGKDTLLDYARARLSSEPSVLFARRVVTRAALASAEDHHTLTPQAFAAAQAAGDFTVAWQAHGLHYAIPAEVHRHVAAGGVAIVNGSRAALPAIREAFQWMRPVLVTCRPDILAQRLAARGRESPHEQTLRLGRAVTAEQYLADAIEIDNSDSLEISGAALVAIIRAAMR